jgi:hypothetical protein
MAGNEPLSIEEYPPETQPIELYQTGYDKLQIMQIHMPFQSAAGVGISNMPQDQDEFGNSVFSDDDAIEHIELGHDGMKFFQFLSRNTATAITHLRVYASGTRPTVNRTKAHCALLYKQYYEDIKAGLLEDVMPGYDDEGDPASTIENKLKGVSWKDTGVTTKDRHWTKLRQWMYGYGLMKRNEFPKHSARIDQMSKAQEIFDQWIYLYIDLAMIEYFYMIVLAQAQTAQAILKLGILQQGLASKKYEGFGLEPNFDPVWSDFVERTKIDNITGLVGLDKFTPYLDNPIDDTLIKDTTLDTILYDHKDTYPVPTRSLKIARSMFGIGKDESRNTTVHFFNALIGGIPDGDENNISHGKKVWALGLETAIHFQIMRKLQDLNLPKTIEQALINQKHYHFQDLEPTFANVFVEYNFSKSLSGYAEAYARYGLASFMRFDQVMSNTPVLFEEVVSDPQSIHTGGVLDTTVPTFLNQIHVLPVIQGHIPEYYELVFGGQVSMDEIRAVMFFGVLLSLTSSVNWQDNRYSMYRAEICQIIDTVDERILGYAKCLGAEQIRYEFLKDPFEILAGDFKKKFVALKYAHGLSKGYLEYQRNISEPRPRGNSRPVRIIHIGKLEKLRMLAEMIPSVPETKIAVSAAPKAPEEPKLGKPKPPAKPAKPKEVKPPDVKKPPTVEEDQTEEDEDPENLK